MHAIETMERINSVADAKHHLKENPLAVLVIPSHVKSSPDCSGIDPELLAQAAGLNLVKTYFVDSSGFGPPGEPALTYPAFEREIAGKIAQFKPRRLYSAITGIGQFQVYITVMVSKSKKG